MRAVSPKRMPVVLDTRVVCGSGGGPDKTILNSPRFFAKAGYRMLCGYMHPPADPGFEQLKLKAERWQAPILSIPDRGPWDWRVALALLDICRRERVDIWHGHDYKSNALGLVLRRAWPMRLVTTVHGWGVQEQRVNWYYRIDRMCLPRYEKVICVSEDLYDQCLAAGVPRRRCIHVPNAINLQEYSRSQSRADAKQRLGIAPERFVIGAVGRLSAEKAFDLLIRATAQLRQLGFDIELIIVGDGDRRAMLQDLIAELGCGDRVRLLGYQSNPKAAYEAMDMYALSSLREGLPNVVLEAMAMDVPVVATRIAGVPRLIRDRDNGLLIEPGNLDALVLALRELIQDRELRTRLERNGRHTVTTSYDFERRIERLSDLYDRLLGRTLAA
ncbi:MAG: glycosyltransferase [Gemmataceae bacterium]|nr:glycosyltransferase [Gemmataceae bacterium]